MSSIDKLFTTLRSQNRKALMPFVTAGDPDMDFTSAMIEQLVARGASMCEVGIPYSDPIADGPVIQESYTRALDNDIKVQEILQALSQATAKIDAPLVTMVSHAIIYRHGVEQYADKLQQMGIAGMIVPDLPVEESPQLSDICASRGLSLIQLVTPTTTQDRALRIAETSWSSVLCVGGGYDGRASRASSRTTGSCWLVAGANPFAHLHRFWN